MFTTSDGVRLAYTIGGSGPPLVRAIDWLNHLDFEWKNPFRCYWFSEVMCHNTLLRYDQRGSGLSDWNVDDFSFERSLADFEELISAVGWDKFALVGSCQGGSIGAAYAARHPERVTKLVLVRTFARGWPPPGSMVTEQFNAMLTLIRLGWGSDNPAFRQLWTTLFRPDASPAETEWMNEFQRITSSPDNAARAMAELPKIDITDLLPKVCCPTLVIHSRDEAVVPALEGRLIASRIRGARYVELHSRNHEVVPGEPAWQLFVDEFSRFLGWPDRQGEVQPTAAASSGAARSTAPIEWLRSIANLILRSNHSEALDRPRRHRHTMRFAYLRVRVKRNPVLEFGTRDLPEQPTCQDGRAAGPSHHPAAPARAADCSSDDVGRAGGRLLGNARCGQSPTVMVDGRCPKAGAVDPGRQRAVLA